MCTDSVDVAQKLARTLNARLKCLGGPSIRYLNEFCGLKCAPDLLALKLFPNAKEISESFAAYNAVRKHLAKQKKGVALNESGITVVAVGDGCTPRTAATFAFRSAWNCISVDPALKESKKYNKISRLHLIPKLIEDVKIENDGHVIIVAVHSHAPLEAALAAVSAKRVSVVAIPCCKKQSLHVKPDHVYLDWGIWSPERMVMVWENVC